MERKTLGTIFFGWGINPAEKELCNGLGRIFFFGYADLVGVEY